MRDKPLSPELDAVFINLDRAVERRRFMEDQAEALGLSLTRFTAVEAASFSDAEMVERTRAWERPLTRSEFACFRSHELLWRRVAQATTPLLVLEDDVALSRRFMELLPSIAGFDRAEFVNLESCNRRRFVERGTIQIALHAAMVRVHRDKSGSGAYVLWPEGAKKLVAKAAHGAAPVDAFLHGLRSLRSFQIEPALAMQLHIIAARGHATPISAASSIQVPRDRLPISIETLPFHRRRLATQFRLSGDHAMRLVGRRYRRTEVVMADILDGPAYRTAETSRGEPGSWPDQSRS